MRNKCLSWGGLNKMFYVIFLSSATIQILYTHYALTNVRGYVTNNHPILINIRVKTSSATRREWVIGHFRKPCWVVWIWQPEILETRSIFWHHGTLIQLKYSRHKVNLICCKHHGNCTVYIRWANSPLVLCKHNLTEVNQSIKEVLRR